MEINSKEYWNKRFKQDWETFDGSAQTRAFVNLALKLSPDWFLKDVQKNKYSIADFGCAFGEGTFILANKFSCNSITGIDIAEEAIHQAQTKHPSLNFVSTDLLTYPSSFDIVFSSNTLEHFHNPEHILEKLALSAKKYIWLLLPFYDTTNHPEHFFIFNHENVPLSIKNEFNLIFSKEVDVSKQPSICWPGKQVLLIYAKNEAISSNIKQLFGPNRKKRLLYFSPVQWDSYYQRPHYMIKYFLEQHPSHEVIWVNPYPNRFPNLMDFIHKRPKTPKLTPKLPGLQVISLRALPIEPFLGSEYLNFQLFWKKHWNIFKEISHIGIGRPSKLALMALNQLHYQTSFYDAMDDFPEFYRGFSRLSMRHVEQKVAAQVDKIFVSSTALAKKFPHATKILNAYNMQALPDAHSSRSGVFGFVGSIGQWFDWNIVLTLAKAFPNNTIRLIGPCFIPCPETLPKNIELLPECSQPEAIEHIKKFHVGLIPFKQNTLTEGVDPIKYYEYRAMGLPILSTRFGEMQYRETEPGVYFMNSHNIQESASNALAFEFSSTIIHNFRAQNDWAERFNQCEIL